jgi:pyruvate, orthophosphate dikinase
MARFVSPPSTGKQVYLFSAGRTDGTASLTAELGSKGANLAEMARIGLPVPPGFTMTTAVCRDFLKVGERALDPVKSEAAVAMMAVSKAMGATFGDPDNPLLVAVRSGARASMPGMMDTILNLGLNDQTVEGLAKRSGSDRFAYDTYRRFIQMYASVVLGVDSGIFADLLDNYKNLKGLAFDNDLVGDDWKAIVEDFKEAVAHNLDRPFPSDVNDQLWGAIAAVFRSWQNPRANAYRQVHDIPADWGTAVTVQAMVFGNMGETSATGVAFTRNPSTGESELYGEFLPNAQGEDVVAGIRTPQQLTEVGRVSVADTLPSLEKLMPEAFVELSSLLRALERRYRDMQDIEFTIQQGKVFLLQTRSGKRTAEAAIRIAVDLAREGIQSREQAVLAIDASSLSQLLHPAIDPNADCDVLTTGLPASPGAACGEIVFEPAQAQALKSQGRAAILVRVETSPEDIQGMLASVGILTARGGMTSHAAVVARGMGLPCISGAGALRIDAKAGEMRIGQRVLKTGDLITIDGSSGQILNGRVRLKQTKLSPDFAELIGWADSTRRLKVRANADTPRDARQARELGADGIGLCRTEHMFFDADRIVAMREMICASDETGRRAALAKILPMQRADFTELFEIMGDLPVTIRLLDPPLHEFLPRLESELEGVSLALKMPLAKLKTRVAELSEVNPMLGFRGCRVAVRYPEIAEMQARAIFEACVAVKKTGKRCPVPEIMVPFVAFRREFDLVADIIRATAAKVEAESGSKFDYEIGTMIELPRAALRSEEIVAGPDGAAFISFGTNDLTQTALGLSRDDAAPILNTYAGLGIFERDPFVSIDSAGVGELVRIGIDRGRAVKPGLKTGICGEHGGDPASVAFFESTGLDYVSCSPFRIPIARLAAAQAVIRAKKTDSA